ncbi:MAG: GyrI-like domain-containing protein [Acidobacteria bacterium]|jgi:effector-binding domain-containing protein|nr:GyrI-like domain-containing protein [Acidobacteriota bacterium]
MKKIICAALFIFMGLLSFTQETIQNPSIKEVESAWYAYMEFTGPYNDMQKMINDFLGQFFSQGLFPAGPAATLYLNSPQEVKPEELKWTFGFIVTPESAPKEPIKKMELKKHLSVVYLHKGPYDKLPQAYEIALKFIKDNGYNIAGPICDKYLNNPMSVTPENLETEIIIPIDKKQ